MDICVRLFRSRHRYTSASENDDGLMANWDIIAGHGMTIHNSIACGSHGLQDLP